MAAETGLSAVKIPRDSIAISETRQTWREITMPSWARRVVISPQTNAINVRVSSVSGLTDNDAFTDTVTHGAESVAGDAKYSVPLTAGRGNIPQCSVWIQAPTNPTVIEIAVEEHEVG